MTSFFLSPMAVELSSHLNKSPDHVNDGSFEPATSTGVIINAYASKHKETGPPNYFTFNSFMEQSPAIQEPSLVSGILHRHTSNHIVLGDNSKAGYFSSNANQAGSFQRVGVNNSNFITSHSPQRTDLDLSPRQSDNILMSHASMFDQASTSSNVYNHSFGILAGNGSNLHATANLMNASVDMKPTVQSLQPHSFYTHSELPASHDQNTVQRPSMSPLFGSPMGYRAYPQIGELFQPRAEFYAQQPPFGHPQYW